jgi:hypothetical protein
LLADDYDNSRRQVAVSTHRHSARAQAQRIFRAGIPSIYRWHVQGKATLCSIVSGEKQLLKDTTAQPGSLPPSYDWEVGY